MSFGYNCFILNKHGRSVRASYLSAPLGQKKIGAKVCYEKRLKEETPGQGARLL